MDFISISKKKKKETKQSCDLWAFNRVTTLLSNLGYFRGVLII